MPKGLIHGVHAAVLAARDQQGMLNEAALRSQLEFLLKHGIRKFAFNGATGEYCLSSPEELRRTLQIARGILPADASFLCGVGAAGFRGSLNLGEIGMEAGADALLVPMPYFFPYSQGDLEEFVCRLAEELPAPILLYNLPQFTSVLEPETVVQLLRETGNVVGIKDSSGTLNVLRTLTQLEIDASRLIGNDGVLGQALVEKICDGVVSGVACVLPEVIHSLFSSCPGDSEFDAAAARLSEFIAQIDALPVPWGLKVIAEARGIAPAIYHQPVSAQRAKQIKQIVAWFDGWMQNFAEA